MSQSLPERFEQKRVFLEKRAEIIAVLRSYFEQQGYVEVQTPVLQVCPTMDTHIHAFETELYDRELRPVEKLYLHTSPELDMKKLLVVGMERIYQICPAFRNAEVSRLHSPEFTMLEWYRIDSDYTYLMDEVDQILGLFDYGVCERLSVCDAFDRYAGIALEEHLNNRDSLASVADVRVIDTDQWDDIFHAIMAEKIEPNLKQTILYDYPISMAALSRPKVNDPRFAERFELYLDGVEIANAFSELTDVFEQRKRFDTDMEMKEQLYGVRYPADEKFFEALDHGLPSCAGIALGLDRLVMILTGAKRIDDVLWKV